MSKNKKLSFLPAVMLSVCLILSQNSFSDSSVSKESFLPPNHLQNPINSMSFKSGITEKQFNEVIDEVEAVYAPIVAAHGGTLVFNRLWSDPTVNSDAEQVNGQWIINSYGGLARDKHMTQDGFALVACHEMGHHLGGAPKYGGGDNWASDEGEADYFSTSKCLHRVFKDSGSAQFTRFWGNKDSAFVRKACAKSYPNNQGEISICVREAMAGLSVSGLLAELTRDHKPLHFYTPDTHIVSQTNDDHPAAQCRLDTYFQGALCNKSYLIDMSNTDPAVGACVLSQGYSSGIRPLCWYKPSPDELPPSIHVANASSNLKTNAMSFLKSPSLWKGR